jgi:hypothetical protein
MKKEFVMRGQTAKGATEVLNFSGYKPGYAYRLVEFQLSASTNVAALDAHMCAVITAGKTALDPQNPNFNDEALIGSTQLKNDANDIYPISSYSIINDTFLITQNLLLTVYNNEAHPINWQCRFESVKMSGSEEASTNYKQFMISDGS